MELRDNQQDEVEVDWVEGLGIRGGLDLNHDDILVAAFLPTIWEREWGWDGGGLMATLWDFDTQGKILEVCFQSLYFSGCGTSSFSPHNARFYTSPLRPYFIFFPPNQNLFFF